jgi:DNA-binding transcriptional LysR family regulator
MKQKAELEALTHFDAAATHGGFGRAARASGVAKATISRQISALEQHLQLRLIHRDNKAFALTDEGRLLFERTHDLLAELDQTLDGLRHDRGAVQGRLRVSCPLMFGHTVMGREAAAFARAYPDIRMEVTVEERQVDLIAEDYDVVIRVNPDPQSLLVGRCIMRSVQHLIAPPGLKPPTDATTPVRVVTRLHSPEDQVLPVSHEGQTRDYRLLSVLRLPSPMMQRDAVLVGDLAAILPYKMVEQFLKQGTLQDWGRLVRPPVEVWALHQSRRLTSARVRAFMDFFGERPEWMDVRG